jgi:hypothetical protein
MTRKLIIKQVGVIRKITVKSEIQPDRHPVEPPKRHTRDIFSTGCGVEDHITFAMITSWSVNDGVFNPQALYQSKLKQHNQHAAEVVQSLPELSPGTYQLTIVGSAVVSFENGGTYSWSKGSQTNEELVQDETVSITFNTSAPDTIKLALRNQNHVVDSVSMKDASDNSHIQNGQFTEMETHFYDLQSWFIASVDPKVIPPDTLGYLQGYNEHELYTVFE